MLCVIVPMGGVKNWHSSFTLSIHGKLGGMIYVGYWAIDLA